ncbi:WbqC family protein [Alteromonas stellipolaris]|uniref:WbqC family protein n=1 Tax=Alteromonas stellipolaris TaxID=233316 RepID=UPI001E35DB30|nr:WbqC family protein [Alteromonas stellipolaris]
MADTFVLMDNVQYQKNGMQNRNQINSSNGPLWLTVPISGSLKETIEQKQPVNNKWKKKHIQSIRSSYGKAPFFKRYFDDIAQCINDTEGSLHNINFALINYFRSIFLIQNKLLLLSDLNVNSKKNQLVVDTCLQTQCAIYLSGVGAKAYLERDEFQANNVTLRFLSNELNTYHQMHREKASGLSILDWLMQDEIESIIDYLHKPGEYHYES